MPIRPINSKLPFLLVGVLVLVGIIFVSYVLLKNFGGNYGSQLITPPQQQLTLSSDSGAFSVRRIVIRKNDPNCGGLEITRNGNAKLMDCINYIEDRTLVADDTLEKLFYKLTLESFNKLQDKYFLTGLEKNITIIIETTSGTKIITITGDDNTLPDLDDDLDDIIDITDDIEEDINEDDPTPPPVPSTPTPTPGFLPTPTPTATPTPAPGSSPTPQPSVEPFSCEQLQQQGVTVSNIRCLDEE